MPRTSRIHHLSDPQATALTIGNHGGVRTVAWGEGGAPLADSSMAFRVSSGPSRFAGPAGAVSRGIDALEFSGLFRSATAFVVRASAPSFSANPAFPA